MCFRYFPNIGIMYVYWLQILFSFYLMFKILEYWLEMQHFFLEKMLNITPIFSLWQQLQRHH